MIFFIIRSHKFTIIYIEYKQNQTKCSKLSDRRQQLYQNVPILNKISQMFRQLSAFLNSGYELVWGIALYLTFTLFRDFMHTSSKKHLERNVDHVCQGGGGLADVCPGDGKGRRKEFRRYSLPYQYKRGYWPVQYPLIIPYLAVKL